MATLTSTPKHSATLTNPQKKSTGEVFFGWMFWFTRPIFNTPLSTVPKHGASLTSVPKH